MADIGYNSLILALVISLYSTVVYFIGAKKQKQVLIKSARNATVAAAGLVTLAVIVLLYSILTHNFQLEYVVNYTSRQMSVPYLISALWAGNDGSMLFWAWLLSICGVLVVFRKRHNTPILTEYSLSVTMFTLSFLLIVLLSVSNPFIKSAYAPSDGIGLNPMLENPGMIIHPPLLLAGYVVFTIPFSYAIAALITSRFGYDWIASIRKWVIIAWLLLGVGNVIGAWWAYVELGWGGYWAWDPVENAGLMPWLLSTAFLHSIMMQKRSGNMKIWNMILIIFAFILVIFGTYLTRSGVLSSVHSYAEEGVGIMFVVFIAILLAGSLGLLVVRGKELKSESEIQSLVSREGTFLLTNILFVLATLVIFLGTVFPGITEAISGAKITVGPSFFNQVNGPLFSLIILLIGVCTVIGWKNVSLRNYLKQIIWPGVLAALCSALLFIFWIREWIALFAFFFSGLVLFIAFSRWWRNIHSRHKATGENYFNSFVSLFTRNKNRYGAYIVHIGIIILAIGVIGSSLFDVEKTETLGIGDTMEIGNYSITFNGVEEFQTGYKDIVQANLMVDHKGNFLDQLKPERVFHEYYSQAVTEVAIRSTLAEDLYIALGGVYEDGMASFQVSINPLVVWIWIGGGVLALGGIICFWPKAEGDNTAGDSEIIADGS